MTVGEKVKALREKRGLSQNKLAKMAGIAQPTLSAIEHTTKSPNIMTVELIANALGVSPNALLADTQQNDGTWIPVLGNVSAGIPMTAIEDYSDEWEQLTPEMLASGGEYFALRISGDSMEAKISDGDIVIVRKQNDAENGDICVVLVDGEDATVKRIRKTENGLWIVPDNPQYLPRFFSSEEIETLPVQILGKVVELRAKF